MEIDHNKLAKVISEAIDEASNRALECAAEIALSHIKDTTCHGSSCENRIAEAIRSLKTKKD